MSARFERKYRVTDRQAKFLRACWEPHLMRAPFTDEDGAYPVLSQYFDSPGLRFYHQKHDGVGKRRKVRLRTYGYRFEPSRACFLEIKHRDSETVAKTRVALPRFRPEHLQPRRWQAQPDERLAPFRALQETHRLSATAQVLYVRHAFQAVVEKELRITFDSMLTGLHPGEQASPDLLDEHTRSIVPETEMILEVKGRDLLPEWVREAVAWLGLRQEPVPKYVLAMDRLNLIRLGTGVYA